MSIRTRESGREREKSPGRVTLDTGGITSDVPGHRLLGSKGTHRDRTGRGRSSPDVRGVRDVITATGTSNGRGGSAGYHTGEEDEEDDDDNDDALTVGTSLAFTTATTATMKHPNEATEAVEFNIGLAVDLRCKEAGQKIGTCVSCESCKLSGVLTQVFEWFSRAGDSTRRRFLLGLVRRVRSSDILKRILTLLKPAMASKDRAYACVRPAPGLKTDTASTSADRALDPDDLEFRIADTWNWFSASSYWTKSTFILSCLQKCEAHLVQLVGVQAQTILASEERAFTPKDEYEAESIPSSRYTYNTDVDAVDRPTHTPILTHPFKPDISIKQPPPKRPTGVSRQNTITWDEIVNDDSGNESLYDPLDGSGLDPSCFVVPHSAKGYSGVAKYKDFIQYLPIHLAKMILGFLEEKELDFCRKVSRRWAVVVDEVMSEVHVNEELRQEVMLMQGAAAHGCNPHYAKDIDVLVPNVISDTYETIRTGEEVKDTTFKSEVDIESAYSGYSTRKIIMEERNVYCGPYNVMVLPTLGDNTFVINTDDKLAEVNMDENRVAAVAAPPDRKPTKLSRLIALGCHDKKVRFINSDTGRFEGPTIWGHAGSIKCVAINSPKGYVLSGSYDTSIRMWSIRTRKCLKILHGHRDTITCLQIYKDLVVSGSRDKTCKVWHLQSGKCIRTFKHKHAVCAVALDDELCISGDEGVFQRPGEPAPKEAKGGEVKVWNMKNGDLIKKLVGHRGPITAVQFDRWHIITGSRDGYALGWSSQGDHRKCMSALRHPKEVLCLAFAYLRVVTGSADGKLRIWNLLTGQCLRIMRGNSRSDPILSLIAINNRITFNTSNMLLVLNFEQLEYDYTLENDKMPSLVKYSKYSDAKIREHPYTYIRAQRMKKAGASNPKIVQHSRATTPKTTTRLQISHSAKTLSERSIKDAKRVQSAGTSRTLRTPATMVEYEGLDRPLGGVIKRCERSKPLTPGTTVIKSLYGTVPANSSKYTGTSFGEPASGKSGTMSAVGFRLGTQTKVIGEEDDSVMSDEDGDDAQRRVSWAFEHPLIPESTKPLGLNDTKALLRSQIRAKGKPIPPDFIYLSINSIQANMRPTQASRNMEINRRERELTEMKQSGRPSSSPSRIDPRTKVPKEQLGVDGILIEHGLGPTEIRSESGSRMSGGSKHAAAAAAGTGTGSSEQQQYIDPYGRPVPTSDTYVTDFCVRRISTAPTPHSKLPRHIQSTIPEARLLRPHTATMTNSERLDGAGRRHGAGTPTATAVVGHRPWSAAVTTHSSLVGGPNRHRKEAITTTDRQDAKPVPMKMYSKEVLDRVERLKSVTKEKAAMMGVVRSASENGRGNVSQFNMPFRTHVNFELKTHDQVTQELRGIEERHHTLREREQRKQDRKQRRAWLESVKKLNKQKCDELGLRPKK